MLPQRWRAIPIGSSAIQVNYYHYYYYHYIYKQQAWALSSYQIKLAGCLNSFVNGVSNTEFEYSGVPMWGGRILPVHKVLLVNN